eukprot:TRINITY_DN102362_c0_g1_i1.p1 TRINITY_DN102362_c0_g1~~TRINITY_DN102362_c0_g1_i1.p1  ORF type:complete len:662 (+),score=86.37 TRINITY_DN102362_c0_g1_i1:49-1986(+)
MAAVNVLRAALLLFVRTTLATRNDADGLSSAEHRAFLHLENNHSSCGVNSKRGHCTKMVGCEWNTYKKQCTAKWALWNSQGPKYSDIAQGDLASCYFLATLASIADTHPDIIVNMFKHRLLWKHQHPVYTSEWLLGGAPTLVAVDEVVPAWDNAPMFVSFTEKHAMWPLLLEKAWAKIFGNYKNIEYGYGVEAFKAVTQAPVDYLYLEDFGSYVFSKDAVWESMLDAVKRNFPMVAGTGDNTTNGIAAGHVYAVRAAELKETGGIKHGAVRLYNPWSYSKYQGDMPNDIDELASGDFWMKFDEFVAAFQSVTIARVQQFYRVFARKISVPSKRTALSFEFRTKFDFPFSVQLEWPSWRLVQQCRGAVDPRVIVEVFKDDKSLGTASRTGMQRWISQANVRVDLPGEAGTYRVSVYAEIPEAPYVRKLVLNAYAKEFVNFKQISPGLLWPHTVELAGFSEAELNAIYTENTEEQWAVSNLSTYWTESFSHFIFWCADSSVWMVTTADAGGFATAQAGTCWAYASAPEDTDLLDAAARKGWSEYDGSAWVEVPSAGVARLGDFRPTSTHRRAPEPSSACSASLERLNKVNNWREIRDGAGDSMFPANLTSIASPGQTCGDAAHNINNGCEYYNHWSTITDMMAAAAV